MKSIAIRVQPNSLQTMTREKAVTASFGITLENIGYVEVAKTAAVDE